MDQSRCQKAVKEVLSRYAKLRPAYGEVRFEGVFDDEAGRYVLLQVGWDPGRIVGVIVYVCVDAQGVHVEADGIEHGIVDELIELGVPEEAIDFPAYERSRTPGDHSPSQPLAAAESH
jgi:hypothetical protein